MRNMFNLVLLLFGLQVCPVTADDIEAYLYGTEGVFVQVVMDLGDSSRDSALCTFPLDCRPPFMSAAAFRHLEDMYQEGESVTAPGVFRAVLSAVLENPLLDNLSLSLLISNHQDNPASDPTVALGGGTILQGYRKLQTHRADVIATLKALPTPALQASHTLQPRETYFEWLRYLVGGEVALGRNTVGNFGSSQPHPDYDQSILENGKYVTPFKSRSECPQLYSMLFTLGSPAHDENLDTEIVKQLPDLGQNTFFSQFLAYLHQADTDLLPQTDTVVPLQTTWVVTTREQRGNALDYAIAGDSEPLIYVDDPLQLQARLTARLLQQVAVAGYAMDAAFSNDVFARGQVLDALFLPQFLPQAGSNWPGNLKKLKLELAGDRQREGEDLAIGQVLDARGAPAYEGTGGNRGRLRLDALTFWTDVATLPRDVADVVPNDADGPVVARGGAGQKIDGFVEYNTVPGQRVHYFIGDTNTEAPVNGYGPRQLFYAPMTGGELLPFDADAQTATAIRPLLDPEQTLADEQLLNLIRWARGQEIDAPGAAARGWLLGEVMHSRPFALNYGATPGYSRDNPNVRVMFGSGDGAFHIVQSTDTAGRESGREVFGFFPAESLPAIRWRHENNREGLPKYYGVDGAPVVLRVDHNDDGTLDHAQGDEAYVFFGMRRGGSSYFALDISDPDAVPRLAWRISRTVGGAFDELGLSFSTPVVGKVNYSGRVVDVLIFAGGYDGGWNHDFTARLGKDLDAGDDAVGNALYIVNARTGELIWKAVNGQTGTSSNSRYMHAGLVDSIPSTVSALVTPQGVIHRVYVGDTGGAVWRVDLPPNSEGRSDHRRDNWFITKLADLGFDANEPGGSSREDRRFFHAPDIVQSFDESGDFDGLLIQSGNRADPNETLVENALFYLKDREIMTGSAVAVAENTVSNPAGRYQVSDLVDQTDCIDGTEQVVSEEGSVDCATRGAFNGWQVRFGQPGEKGLSTPLTDGGTVFASTFTPGEVTSCGRRQGQGRLYVLRLRNATAAANSQRHYELGDGIPAPARPVADAIFLPGGGIDLYDLDGDHVRDTTQLLPSHAQRLYRTYWREPGIDPL